MTTDTVRTHETYRLLDPITRVERGGHAVTLHAGDAALRLTTIDDGLVRVQLLPHPDFSARPSYAIDPAYTPAGPDAFAIEQTDDELRLRTALLDVRVALQTGKLSAYTHDGTLLHADAEGAGWRGEGVAAFHQLQPDTVLYGLGDKTKGFDRNGHRFHHWNTDAFGFSADADPLYKTYPFLLALRDGVAHGLFYDNPAPSTFDCGAADAARLTYTAETGALDYYLFHAPTPLGIVRAFGRLTGTQPMLPKWALGYHQCRYSYMNEADITGVARELRTRKIPCDVLYFDIDYMDGYRVFTWNREAFPEPERLIADLRADGFRSVVIVDPGVKQDDAYPLAQEGLDNDLFCRYPDGEHFIGEVWPGLCYFPDFTNPETRAWWGDWMKVYADQGVDGVWCDMNEPAVFTLPGSEEEAGTMPPEVRHHGDGHPTDHRELHNVYGQQMLRAVYDGFAKHAPEKRPFTITRAAYAGAQRYGTAWTGDNSSTWEHLKLALDQVLSLNVSGYTFVGCDVGGFCGEPTGELLARWTQVGAFTPLFRNHSAAESPRQEPYLFGDEVERVCREAIELRYRLLPYWYTQLHHTSASAEPLLYPLALVHPKDEKARAEDLVAFYCGPDLIVHPVVEEGQTARDIYLPAGTWYDFATGEKHHGPVTFEKETPLDVIPLFARAGSVVPMQPVMQHTGEQAVDTLTLRVYPTTGAFAADLYEDAGDGWAFRSGDYYHARFAGHLSPAILTLDCAVEGAFSPSWKSWRFEIHGLDTAPTTVTADGKPVEFAWDNGILTVKTSPSASLLITR